MDFISLPAIGAKNELSESSKKTIQIGLEKKTDAFPFDIVMALLKFVSVFFPSRSPRSTGATGIWHFLNKYPTAPYAPLTMFTTQLTPSLSESLSQIVRDIISAAPPAE